MGGSGAVGENIQEHRWGILRKMPVKCGSVTQEALMYLNGKSARRNVVIVVIGVMGCEGRDNGIRTSDLSEGQGNRSRDN